MIRFIYSFAIWLFLTLPILVADEKATDIAKPMPPNPFHLEPSWWDYYSSAEPPFEEKIRLTEEEMAKILSNVEESHRKDIQVLMQRFITNLEAILKVRKQPVTPFITEPFHDSYSLDDELQVAHELRELRIKQDDFAKDKQKLQDRYYKLSHHIDTLFASYLQLDDPTHEKLCLGLEVMSLRAGLQLTDEEAHLMNKMAVENRKAVDFKQKEFEQARSNLKYSEADIDELYKKIAEAEDRLKNSQLLALRAETDALGPPGESLKDRLDRSYLLQKSAASSVGEALAQIEVIYEKAKQAYFEYLMSPSIVDLDETHQKIAKWRATLTRLGRQSKEWRSKLEDEVQNSGSIYAHLETESNADSQQLMRKQQSWYQEVQKTLLTLQSLDSKIYATGIVLDQFSSQIKETNSSFLNWWNATFGLFVTCCNPINEWMHSSLVKIGDVPLTPISIFHVFLILLFTYLTSFVLRSMLVRLTKEHDWVAQSSLFILNRLIHYAVLFLGVSLALSSIGLNFSNLAIVLGALSVGIGFGLQTIVNNFFSSLIILFTRPFNVGDIIETASGKIGKVIDITIQHTIVHTGDGIDVIVPNSEMISHQVTNWTMGDSSIRKHIPFGVAYGSDKELVVRVVEEAALKVPCTMKGFERYDDPQVWLVSLGENSLNFELVVWVNICGYGHRGSIDASYLWEIETALKENNIVIPYPQRDVNIRSSVPLRVESPMKMPMKGLEN